MIGASALARNVSSDRMSRLNPLFYSFGLMLLVLGPISGGAVRAENVSLRPEDFIPVIQSRAMTERLDELAAVFENDPEAVASLVDNEIGGRIAMQRYARAMVEAGAAARLGQQWALLIADPDSLGRPVFQDGGVRFPLAANAGFATGAMMTALKDDQEAAERFARGADISTPVAGEAASEWLMKAAAPLSRPARAAFGSAMRAGAHQE